MGFGENNHLKAGELAFLIPALSWAGSKGKMTTNGARKAAKLTKAGTSWTLATGKDLEDGGWSKASDYPKDSVWLIEETGKDANGKSKVKRTKIGDDFGKWHGHLKDAMKGAFNGGVKYDVWVSKNKNTWAIVVTSVTVAAAIVVSVVATPAAGAGVLAAGSALAGAIKAGDTGEALETMATDGTLEQVAEAAGADPATVSAISDAASTIEAALADEPEPAEPEEEQAPVPKLTLWARAGQLLDQGKDYATENPGKSAAGAGLVLLSILTGRKLI